MSNRPQMKSPISTLEQVTLDIETGHESSERMLAKLDDEILLGVLPVFRTKQVSEFFFFRSVSWLRWQEQVVHAHPEDEGVMVSHFIDRHTGEKIEPRRSENNLKIWTLADVENLAHTLHSWHAISTRHLVNSLILVRYMALGYEVLQ